MGNTTVFGRIYCPDAICAFSGKHEWIPLDFGYFRTCLMDPVLGFSPKLTSVGPAHASRTPNSSRTWSSRTTCWTNSQAFTKDPDARG